jgi:L-rhamnonate dehydratase
MKITNIRTVQPVAGNSPNDWRTTIGQILVAIDTDCGLTGYGVGGGGIAGMHIVRTVLRDLLLDRDPEPIEQIWDLMYRSTLAFGRKGIAIMAISGVDLALWDLRGKAARQPVAEILGGTTGVSMPTYSTVWDDITPEQARMHSAFKLHVENRTDGDPVSAVVSAVENARSVLGASKPLMLDAWME